MDKKKFILASLSSFAFIFVFDWVFHGMILKDLYESTMHLWRSVEESGARMHFLTIAQLLFAILLTLIYTKGNEGKGIAEGARFGLLLGLVTMLPAGLVDYTFVPYPSNLITAWVIGGTIQVVGAGIIISLFYKS